MQHKAKIYFYLALLLALSVLAWIVVKPYISAILFALVAAYMLYPLQKKLSIVFKPVWGALLITALFSVVIIFLVQYGIIFLIKEFANISVMVGKFDLSAVSQYLPSNTSNFLTNAMSKIISGLIDSLSAFISGIPKLLVSVFIFLGTLFYMLKDGEEMYKVIHRAIPLPTTKRAVMLDEIKRYINAFVRSQLFIGLIQGVVAGVGFYLFKLHYGFIAAVAAAILSIIPIIGPYLLYLPVGASLVLIGNIGAGVGLLVYGLGIGSFLDYVIRPYLSSKYAQIHPLFVIIGVIGGISAMGLVGVLVGPIAISILYVILKGLDVERFLFKAGIK